MRSPNSGGTLEKTTLTLSKKVKKATQKKMRRLQRTQTFRHSLSSLTDELYSDWVKKPDSKEAA